MENEKIIQLAMDYTEIAIFDNVGTASQKTKFRKSDILGCCMGQKDHVRKTIFRFANPELDEKGESVRKKRKERVSNNHKKSWEGKTRPVYQFTLDGQLISCFNSALEAAKTVPISLWPAMDSILPLVAIYGLIKFPIHVLD